MMAKPTINFVMTLSLLTITLWVRRVEPSIQPDFVEPIKNITSRIGTNVEFSCAVTNLGSYRIMWLKKDSLRKETFVAVNQLKISKNPRISITMLQISDEITQSTIYLSSIEFEDRASYECAINTNPMISRTGTLDIPTIPDEVYSTNKPDLELEYATSQPQDLDTSFKTENVSDTSTNFTLSETQEFFNESILEDDKDVNGSGSVVESGCEEMKSYWEDATDNIKEMLKNVLTSLVNFTCSFLTPSQ